MIGRDPYRLAIRNDFSVQLVHRHQGRGVRVELDEGMGSLLPGEFIFDELKLFKAKFNLMITINAGRP
jgi:hypothetical protein